MDVRFRFEDQDFFEADPVRYASALGERGLRAYREAVAESATPRSFAGRYANERLALPDGAIDELVRLLGGDLSNPYQFQRVTEAMLELDRPDLALGWATRGSKKRAAGRSPTLYDLAGELHVGAGAPSEALRLRRAHHERAPPPRPTAPCERQPGRATRGISSAMRGAKCSSASTCGRSSGCCWTTATTILPGKRLTGPQPTTSTKTCG